MQAKTRMRKSLFVANFQNLKVAGDTLRAAQNSLEVLDFAIKIFLDLGFDRVRVWLIDEEKREVRGGKASHIPDKIFCKICVSLEEKLKTPGFLRSFKDKRPFINRRSTRLKEAVKRLSGQNLESTIEFPILAGKNMVGTLNLDNAVSGRPLDIKKMEALMPFVNQVALAYDRANLREKLAKANEELKQKIVAATAELQEKNNKLKRLAHYDDLSGLPNRRYLEKYLRGEWKKASARHPLTLSMLDIDFLKQVNDVHGHNAGDKLIAKIGEILAGDKNIDFAARFAGDEFVFLLSEKPLEKQRAIHNRLLHKIKTATKGTASIGCATGPSPEIKSETDLLRSADDALYHAKHTGRDRFVCALDKNERVIPLAERRQELQKIEKHGTFAIDYIRQLQAVNKISECLRFSASKNDLQRVARALRRELDFERVYIYVEVESGGELQLAATAGVSPKTEQRLQKEPFVFSEKSTIVRAMRQKRVVDTRKMKVTPKFTELFRTRTALVIPLIGSSSVVGVIVAEYKTERCFRGSDYRFFLTIGDQIENSISKSRSVEKIKNFNLQLKKEIASATRRLKRYSKDLERKVTDNQQLRRRELRANFELISALVTSLEEKDIYTRGHSVRVASYACKLGAALGFEEKRLTNLRYAGLLHDVGKVAIDQSVLNKREALTEDEAAELEKHPVIGEKIVSSVHFLHSTGHIIRHHHERWDGTGYPDRKKGKKAPLESRILALADAYDAMITRRSYGYEMTQAEAVKEIEAGSGKQFDPKLVKIFVNLLRRARIKKLQSNKLRISLSD